MTQKNTTPDRPEQEHGGDRQDAAATAEQGASSSYIPTLEMITYIDSRARGIESAAQRGRWVFAMLFLISILMLSLAFSETLSWSRKMAESAEREWIASLDTADDACDAASGKLPECLDPASGTAPGAIAESGTVQDGTVEDGMVEDTPANGRASVPDRPRESTAPSTGHVRMERRCPPGSFPVNDRCVEYDYKTMRDGLPYVLREEYLKVWTDSLFFDVPLLGVRFNTSDGGVIGSFAILLFTLMAWFATRRENHLIYYFIKDLIGPPFNHADRAYARTLIMSTQIFYRGWHDEALLARDLEAQDPVIQKIQRPHFKLARRLAVIVFWLPSISIISFLLKDVYSLMLDSPFRAGDATILQTLIDSCDNPNILACDSISDVFFRLSFAAILLAIQMLLAWKILAFQKGTEHMLTYMREKEWKLHRDDPAT